MLLFDHISSFPWLIDMDQKMRELKNSILVL